MATCTGAPYRRHEVADADEYAVSRRGPVKRSNVDQYRPTTCAAEVLTIAAATAELTFEATSF